MDCGRWRPSARHRKIAEADTTDFIAALQGRRDDLKHGFDRPAGVIARKAGAVGYMADEFLLVHASMLPDGRTGLASPGFGTFKAISVA